MIDRTLPKAFVVESNEANATRLSQFLASMRFDVQCFSTAEEFLSAAGDQDRGCIVTGLRLSGMSGLELQAELNERNSLLPVILVAERVSTQLVVKAMRNGALAFLDLPINEDELWLAIREAMTLNTSRIEKEASERDLRSRFSELSEGEVEVLAKVCEGLTNKEIAALLDVSIRTIESRRRKAVRKNSERIVPRAAIVLSAVSKCYGAFPASNNDSNTN